MISWPISDEPSDICRNHDSTPDGVVYLSCVHSPSSNYPAPSFLEYLAIYKRRQVLVIMPSSRVTLTLALTQTH